MLESLEAKIVLDAGGVVLDDLTDEIANHAPIANNDIYQLAAGTRRVELGREQGVLRNDRDPDETDNMPVTLTAALLTPAAHGEVQLFERGGFEYIAPEGFSGVDSFEYKAFDGELYSAPATVRIFVGSQNNAPIAESDFYEAPLNRPLEVGAEQGVLANDGDPDGNPITAHLEARPEYGEIELREDGSFNYYPSPDIANQPGFQDGFTYYVSDGNAISNVARVNIVLSGRENHAPHAESDRYDLPNSGRLEVGIQRSVLINDSDPDGDSLTALLANSETNAAGILVGPRHGELHFQENGTFVYEALDSFPGEDAFAYFASDGELRSNMAIVHILGAPQNSPPVAQNDEYTMVPGTAVLEVGADRGLLANDSDPDGDELTIDMQEGPRFGTVTIQANGSFRYVRNNQGPATAEGDSFTYLVSDGQAVSNIARVFIRFSQPENHAPIAEGNEYEIGPNGVLEVGRERGVLSNDEDPDGDELTAIRIAGPEFGELVLNPNGSLRYVPGPNFRGQDSFRYVAFDGTLRSNEAFVHIHGEFNENHAPIAVNDGYEITSAGRLEVGTDRGVLANDSDPDGDELTAHLVDEPITTANGELIGGPRFGEIVLRENGSFVYEAGPNFPGFDSFAYRASDGELRSNVAIVRIGGEPANRAPIAKADEYRLPNSGRLEVGEADGVLANDEDPDGDDMSAHLVEIDVAADGVIVGPLYGRVELRPNGSFVYEAFDNFTGQDHFAYYASDGQHSSRIVLVHIGGEPSNHAPHAEADRYELDANARVLEVGAERGVLKNDSDPDSDLLKADLVEPPQFGDVVLHEDGSFRYVRDDSTVAPNGDSFAYAVTDGSLRSNVARVFISFSQPQNHAPHAESDSYQITASGRLEVGVDRGVLANDTDPDGDTLTAYLANEPNSNTTGEIFGGPRFGEVVLRENGSFVYEAGPNFPGFDSFTYYASDGRLRSNVAVVRIGNEPTNHAPVAVSDRYEVAVGQSLTVGVERGLLHNDFDRDGDPLTVEQIIPPELPNVVHGQFDLRPNGSFVYTPPAGFRGIDTFRYVATDGSLRSDVATIEFVVRGDTQVRTIDIGERSAPAGETVSVPIRLDNASDVIAADLLISYDASLLSTSNTSIRLGRLTSSWQLVANVEPLSGVIDVSMFGTELLRSVDGAILWIDFQVSPNAQVGDLAAVDFVEAALNEGRLESTATNGLVRVARPTLRVRDAQPNRSGVSVSISDRADVSRLNLFRGLSNPGDIADVTLAGEQTGPVHGSLHWNEASQQLEFIRTGGALVPDTYTLTIRSGLNSLHGADGEALDGDADGEAGGNFVTRFIVEASNDRMLGLPDFVRAAGQDVALQGTAGLPIHLDDGTGVTEISFSVQFDPAALAITDAVLGASVPDDWQIDAIDLSVAGLATVRASGSTALSAGDSNPIVFATKVADDAVSGSTHVVRLGNVQLNNGSIAATGDQALQVVALFGDVTGNGDFSSLDASFISRVAVGLDSGFDDYGLIDPMLMADVTGDGTISALDAAWIARKAAGLPQIEIPDAPPAHTSSASQATPAPLPLLAAAAEVSNERATSAHASNLVEAAAQTERAQIDLTWVADDRSDRSQTAAQTSVATGEVAPIVRGSEADDPSSPAWVSSIAEFFADFGGEEASETDGGTNDADAAGLAQWDFIT